MDNVGLRKRHLFTTLLCVLVFWIGGAMGSWKFLYDAHPPVTTLVGLYVMLGLLFASVVAAAIALYALWGRPVRGLSRDAR